METFRAYLSTRTWLVVAIVSAALCLRVLTPQGYMPVFDEKQVEVLVCHGAGDGPDSVTLDIPADKRSGDAERCAFADLAMPLLGAIDPIQLALALAFVLALWLSFSNAAWFRARRHLRPPLRGPPATA